MVVISDLFLALFCFFVRKACIRATSVGIIEILPISPNTLSYNIYLFRYD